MVLQDTHPARRRAVDAVHVRRGSSFGWQAYPKRTQGMLRNPPLQMLAAAGGYPGLRNCLIARRRVPPPPDFRGLWTAPPAQRPCHPTGRLPSLGATRSTSQSAAPAPSAALARFENEQQACLLVRTLSQPPTSLWVADVLCRSVGRQRTPQHSMLSS